MNGKWKGRRGSWNAGKGISLGDVWEFGRAKQMQQQTSYIKSPKSKKDPSLFLSSFGWTFTKPST